MATKLFTFFREQFNTLLITGLFLFAFVVWVNGPADRPVDALKEIVTGLLYALLALLGIRPRAATGPTTIQADNIETASTNSGDIVNPQTATGTAAQNDPNPQNDTSEN